MLLMYSLVPMVKRKDWAPTLLAKRKKETKTGKSLPFQEFPLILEDKRTKMANDPMKKYILDIPRCAIARLRLLFTLRPPPSTWMQTPSRDKIPPNFHANFGQNQAKLSQICHFDLEVLDQSQSQSHPKQAFLFVYHEHLKFALRIGTNNTHTKDA